MKDSNENKQIDKASLWDWVKAFSTVTIVGVFSYKVYITPMNLTVDFPTLLSLLLALFSVALAALFYFKATDTSNTFYDNTYNFTKDIAQLLVKIESGFGERLRNLDEGYSSMRDYLQHVNDKPNDNVVEITKKKIEDEKEEMEKVISKRNKIIQNLVEKSNLQEEEKTNVLNELKEKEKELTEAQRELSKMNKRLFIERMDRKRTRNLDLDNERGFVDFTKSHVIKKIGLEKILHAPEEYIIHKFNRIVDEFPRGFIEDLEHEDFFDNGLTEQGYIFLRTLAKREMV